MRTRIIRLGDSFGIRIPRWLVEEAGLGAEVEVVRHEGALVLTKAPSPREGWESEFAKMAPNGEDALLVDEAPTEWDETEWVWE